MHCKSYSHFFSKKFQHICISLDLNFNEPLTNDVVSFEQLGPGEMFQEMFIPIYLETAEILEELFISNSSRDWRHILETEYLVTGDMFQKMFTFIISGD